MSDTTPTELTRPYIVTFYGSVCVSAANRDEAEHRARAWAMRHVTEDAMIPDVEAGAPPELVAAANAEAPLCEDEPGSRLFTVPIAGTFSFIGPGIDAVMEKVRGKLERSADGAREQGVNEFRFEVRPGPPHGAAPV